MEQKPTTREKILRAAAQTFANQGFEGARVDAIAHLAGVNKASIYYNIGNKAALYEAVLTTIFTETFERFGLKIESIDTPEQKLEAYIRKLADVMIGHPYLPKILMREQISEGQHLPDAFVYNITQVLGTLEGILEEGQQKGVFASVDLITIHFMVLGTLAFQITSSPIRRKKEAFKKKFRPVEPEDMEILVRNIVTYTLKAVRKDS
ncbi:MAG: TetR/AcrR family transcriptional regulator [Desulfobacteraceae bacterium]|mgnify:CR=1 FL=1|nr:MAG: TetR/AcrR family transcriptional regulator [Desulfobacteraceae bacterium]